MIKDVYYFMCDLSSNCVSYICYSSFCSIFVIKKKTKWVIYFLVWKLLSLLIYTLVIHIKNQFIIIINHNQTFQIHATF